MGSAAGGSWVPWVQARVPWRSTRRASSRRPVRGLAPAHRRPPAPTTSDGSSVATVRRAEPEDRGGAARARQARRPARRRRSARGRAQGTDRRPRAEREQPQQPDHTAGTTFLGQFLDHDMTFDASSRLAHPTNPQDAPNFRTPPLDLDSVYGAGPVAQQELYEPSDHIKLKLESGGLFEDLPRRADGTAIIGDPRNDENLIIAGLHCAFLLFHNRAVDYVRDQGSLTDPMEVFAEARRLTTWHYHWLIVHEFLPQFVGQAMVDDVLAQRPPLLHRRARTRRSSRSSSRPAPTGWDTAWCAPRTARTSPATAASRSSASSSTRRRRAAPTRTTCAAASARRDGSSAGRPSSTSATARSSRTRRSTRKSRPRSSTCRSARSQATTPRPRSRNATCSATSPGSCRPGRASPGRWVSRRSPRPTSGTRGARRRLRRSTPLWYYVLKEAELVADGLHLGPVGGRIVAEVFIGLLQTDPGSYLATNPRWRPTLPSKSGSFHMTDFLTFAGVDPQSRGQ